ncbi:ankyrin repeat domain-containing protein [Ancylobacter sp. 6x-1]|uniref:Ankyrin repeat domain-containing protein n=1 Tax=Ancylobacter crimeensis TaxID=2579147 RepID=A0ABT0DBT6_9HYPH|nr:ankyrin repeat domain-containing protein [Ancylobacter crimeensis]
MAKLSFEQFMTLRRPEPEHRRALRDALRKTFRTKIRWRKIHAQLFNWHKIKRSEDDFAIFGSNIAREDPHVNDHIALLIIYWMHQDNTFFHDKERLREQASMIAQAIWGRAPEEEFANFEREQLEREKLRRAAKIEHANSRKSSAPLPKPGDQNAPISTPSAPFEWPPYVSEADARSPDAHEGIWLNPFNHYSIPFSHRQTEKARLDAFMKDDRPFLICALVASSGAGKTRLVSEWMRPYVPVDGNDTDWDAGFVRSRDPSSWKEWEITRKTLIVIDYTYGYERVMRAIAEKCLRHGGPKVRVLVVDHVYPDILHDDFFWGSSFTDQKRIDGHKSRVLYEASPIEIKAEKQDSRFIREIIATAARTEAREFSPDDAAIVAAEKILDRMSGSTRAGSPDAVRHPLFAALLGQAIRDSKRDISKWSRRDLIRHYFDRRTRLPWVQSDDNPHAATIGIWVGAYVSIATLLRGVDFSDLEENLPRKILSDRSPIRLSHVAAQSANRIVSSSDLEILKPFEPDILGENSLIFFLQEVKNDDDLLASFINMIYSIFMNDDEEKCALNFIETIQRLTRNLLNDDRALSEVRSAWSTLLHFLDPERFPTDSLLRHAVSVSGADVVRQGRGSLEAKLINRFADRVNVADLHTASAGPLWRQSCTALVIHYDWQASKGRLKTGDVDILFASLARFKDKSETRWPALMLAASEGCLDSAKVNQGMTVDGWTALMAACAAGHTDTAALLLDRGGKVNQGATDDGRTALMGACQGGHTETAALLLNRGGEVNQGMTDTGWTALMGACTRDHTKTAELLLDRGAKVNQSTTDDGRTALMVACAGGHTETAALLLHRDAEVNQGTTDNGWTALMAACEAGRTETAALLLNWGADPDIASADNGLTALIMACQAKNHQLAMNILNKSSRSINNSMNDGMHALFISAYIGDLKMINLIISYDMDIDKI